MTADTQVPEISQVGRAVVFISFCLMFGAGIGIFNWSVVAPGIFGAGFPPTWNWWSVLFLDLFLLSTTWYLGAMVFGRFLAALSASGISYVTLSGRQFVYWTEVQKIETKAQEITVYSPSRKIVLNVYCYRRPEMVLPFVRKITRADDADAV